MKRQILVRGAAIAFAGVAASVFAAQQFMGPSQTGTQTATPGAANQVTGASLMGSSAPSASPHPLTEAELAFDTLEPPAASLNMAQSATPEAEAVDDAAMPEMAALDSGLAPASGEALSDDFQPPLNLAQAAPRANDASCLPTLTAVAAIDALVDMRLTAPCSPNARILVSHDDLAFSAYTDETGGFAAYIPALTQTANIEVFMPDQTVLQAQAVVPEVVQHVRVIVQWTGEDNVLLHGYHRGAAYGQVGHIHASRPFDPELDAAFVLSLGEARGPEPMMSQIYSIPVSMVDQARLELEVAVTTTNCGKDTSAFVSQKGAGLTGALEELSIAMPSCGDSGGMAILPLPFKRPMPVQSATVEEPVTLDLGMPAVLQN